MHAHVRDAAGAHVLDADLYMALLKEMSHRVPEMQVQITTEAVGQYSPDQQRDLVRTVKPRFVSIAVREMVPDDNTDEARAFYYWAQQNDCIIQHILYSAEDLERFK